MKVILSKTNTIKTFCLEKKKDRNKEDHLRYKDLRDEDHFISQTYNDKHNADHFVFQALLISFSL